MSDLTFADWIQNEVKGNLGKTEWLRVYSRYRSHFEHGWMSSALIPNGGAKAALKSSHSDLVDDATPAVVGTGKGTQYHRFGGSSVEPLVFLRDFHGLKHSYFETPFGTAHHQVFVENRHRSAS